MDRIKKFELTGIVFITGLGILFHYIFDWFQISALAWLFPVNESIFEHSKMALFPLLIWMAIEYRYIGSEVNNIWVAKAVELIILFCLHQVPFLLVYQVFEEWGLLAQILVSQMIFLTGIIIGQLVSYTILKRDKLNHKLTLLSLVFILVYIMLVIAFTYYPPEILLFRDTVNHQYGILDTYE
ncbi:MAG: hypothetical protein INQ03_24050 [Candidatus Heimdallarchaeota archaeon]|nr:hypothetical protein [Candidatus Heimdallarchaeota archaeon]